MIFYCWQRTVHNQKLFYLSSISRQYHLQRCVVNCFRYWCFHCERFHMKQTALMPTPLSIPVTLYFTTVTPTSYSFLSQMCKYAALLICHKYLHRLPAVNAMFTESTTTLPELVSKVQRRFFFRNGMMKHCTKYKERSLSSVLLYYDCISVINVFICLDSNTVSLLQTLINTHL